MNVIENVHELHILLDTPTRPCPTPSEASCTSASARWMTEERQDQAEGLRRLRLHLSNGGVTSVVSMTMMTTAE